MVTSGYPLEVFHPYFGYGRVLTTRWAGTMVFVCFDSGLRKWLFTHRLKVLRRGEKTRPHPQAEKQELPATLQDEKEAAKMVEAFRLGVVPQRHIENFTFGRDKEIRTVQEFLNGFRGGQALIIDGPYGAGKTHILDYLSHLAINSNFAISRVELDPFDVTPFRPRSFYREVTRSFRWIGSEDQNEKDFRGFLKALSKRIDKIPDLKRHPVLHLTASYIKERSDVEESFWNWIEGERLMPQAIYKKGNGFPTFLDYSTSADFYCYLLSGVGFFLKNLGIKGLVILIDEGENLEDLVYSWQRERGFNFLKGLIMTAKNTQGLNSLGQLKRRVKATGKEDAGYIDEIGLIHSRIRPYPYLFENPSRLFVVLSLTPSQWRYLRVLRGFLRSHEIIHLSPFMEVDYLTIFERLLLLYQRAYPSFSQDDKMKKFLKRFLWNRRYNIRTFIKGTIEGLDLLRHYPNLRKEDFLRLSNSLVHLRRL